VRLVQARVELDRPLVQLDRLAQLTPGVRIEQIAVIAQDPRVRLARCGPFVQRLRAQKIALLAERLIALEQLLLVIEGSPFSVVMRLNRGDDRWPTAEPAWRG